MGSLGGDACQIRALIELARRWGRAKEVLNGQLAMEGLMRVMLWGGLGGHCEGWGALMGAPWKLRCDGWGRCLACVLLG